MPGKTTTPSDPVTASKTSLEGVPEWEASQDSPTEWSQGRGDSMKSTSSKNGENGSVLSKSSANTTEVGSEATSSGSIETAKEAKEKEPAMKRTSSWMKNLGNGMRTLRLRKGSGSKKKEKLQSGIFDEDASTSTKDDPEVEETPPLSAPSSPSVSVSAVSQSLSKSEDDKKSVDAVVPIVLAIVPEPEPVLEAVPHSKPPILSLAGIRASKSKKRGNSASGQSGTDSKAKPSAENPDKTDPARFVGEGLCFKAKLIGVLEVSGPRGDRICQEALSELKMAVKAAGEHKQKVTIHVALDGLRLRDEKTGDCLYHHQVHKISFIAQDLTDTRAFGYIFGSPDTGHRFFGIKTEKSASQVVMAMRDLFQVVFDLKKKEIERAKQQLEMQQKFLATRAAETAPRSGYKSDLMEGACALNSPSAPAEADLLNLEVELNSLQEGLENIHSNLGDSNTHNSLFNRGSTASISSDPMNPMSPGFKYSMAPSNSSNNANPSVNSHSNVPQMSAHAGINNSFGDTFDPFDSKPTSAKVWPSTFTSDPFTQVDPFAQVDPFPTPKFNSFDSGGEFFTSDPFESTPGASLTFTEAGISGKSSNASISRQNSQASTEPKSTNASRNNSTRVNVEKIQELSKANITGPPGSMTGGWMASFEDNFVSQPTGPDVHNGTAQVSGRSSAGLDIFTELDPLGSGKVRPFVDRKDFFHDLKNPPKKILKDLSSTTLPSATILDHTTVASLSSSATLAAASQQQVLHLPQGQESAIHNSFSTHFNPSSSSSSGVGGTDFESHFKIAPKAELRTSSIRVRLPSSSGDSPPNYSPPPPPPSVASNSVYFINPPVTQIAPPLGSGSRAKRSPGLLRHITISNTPAPANLPSSSPKTLPRSTRLSTSSFSDEIPSLTPPPPPRPPPSSGTLTRTSTTAVPRPHSGNESRRQNYASFSSISTSNAAPEPPPRPLQTTLSDMSSSSSAPPLMSPPPPLPPKKQTVGPTLSSSILGKLLYTSENSSAENEIHNDLPLPLPSRRSGNSTNSVINSSSTIPRYAVPAENSISSPILYSGKKRLEPVPDTAPQTTSRSKMTLDEALEQVASLSLRNLSLKLGIPISQLSYLTIHQLAEQLTMMDTRRNSDVGTSGFQESFESSFDANADNDNEQNDFSTASAPAVFENSNQVKQSSNFDKYAVFRELTLEDASGFSIEEDVAATKVLTTMTSRDSSSERTLQADDGPDLDLDHPMMTTMDDITDVNFSDGDEEGNEKSMLDDEVVDLDSKPEWATFESNFDEQFAALAKAEESPWESDAEADDNVVAEAVAPPETIVIKSPQHRESSPRDQFDFVPFEKPLPVVEQKRRGSQPFTALEEPKFQRQSSSSSKHSDRSAGAAITNNATAKSYQGHPKTNTSDYSADSGKDRPFSGSSSGRRYSRGGGESDEDWSLAPPPSHSASARKIRSHRQYHNDEEVPKPRRRDFGDCEDNEEEDDRSHASYHSNSNSYSRERRPRRYHPQSSKYYDKYHPTSQSLQRPGRYKGRPRNGSPDRYSNHESDFEDSFEDEGVAHPPGRKRDYLREEYWSAGSRPSSSGSSRRYPPQPIHRDRERPDYYNAYHPRENRYSQSHHNRHSRDRDRERIRPTTRNEDDVNEEHVSDFSEEGSGRWAGPGKKPRPKRSPHCQPHVHRGERERYSKHRYYYNTNSPSWDSESPPPGPEVPIKKGGSRGGNGRPSSASQCHHNSSFVNTPPAEERISSAGTHSGHNQGQGRGSSRYQSELALNTSRKLSTSEFRFEDEDFKSSDKQRTAGEPLSLPDSRRSRPVSETNSISSANASSHRPPESPFEDNFVPSADTPKKVTLTANESTTKPERDIFFPTKFGFDSHAIEHEDESLENSLDVSEKSVESLQETPPSLETKSKSTESVDEMKKSNSFNIFARETDPFEDDDFFK